MAQRFGAMQPAPTLSPRYYQAASPVRALGKRELAPCPAGQHVCSDIGAVGVGFCCADDTYCIADPANSTKAACCAIGSVCGSPCSESEFQCIITTTVTSPSPPTTLTTSACCPRQCTQTSMFGCSEAFGGGCCSYGQTCATSGQCIWTSSQSSSAPTVVSQAPAGCTTSQIACPSSLGGGCCAVTQSCTFVAGTGAQCAAITVAPTASGVVAVPQNNDGLGTGAKAGVGVGAVVAVGLVAGAVTWYLLRKRKRTSRGYGAEWRQGPDSDPQTFAGTDSTPRPQSSPRRTGLGILARGDRPSEMTGSHSDIVSRGGRLRGLTTDYFGPDAVPGPFTESPYEGGSVPGASAATTPPGGTNRDRAVPMDPHGPDDITAPVEIDSRARQREVSDTIAGRFELYGSDLQSSRSDGVSPYNEAVSPYTPSPGTMTEGPTAGSPTQGHASNG